MSNSTDDNPQSPMPETAGHAVPNPQSPIFSIRSESGLARSAGILGLGNIASRLLGLVRESVNSGYFAASGQYSAAFIASQAPTMIYDLLIGGLLSAALVPVFSRYAEQEQRAELERIAAIVLTLFACVTGVAALAVVLLAEPIAGLLANFANPELQQVLARSLRVIAPVLLFFGFTGGAFGLLYALRRSVYTALGSAVFNLGVLLAVPLLAGRIGVYAFPLGIVLGGVFQLAIMRYGLRDFKLRVAWDWRHPAIRQIFRLYVPIGLGLIITQAQIVVDRRWASEAAEQAASWMNYATRLRELPLGIVPMAISLAALPTLSQAAAATDWAAFRRTFARGLRLALVLLIPASVGLWVLAEPLIQLVYEHRAFTPADTAMTAAALRYYVLGLLPAGIDLLLIYTFYARQDTITPAAVGVISVGCYLVAAWLLRGPLNFLGLVLADSLKQASHALIMAVLLWRSVGRLDGERMLATIVPRHRGRVGDGRGCLVAGGLVGAAAARRLPGRGCDRGGRGRGRRGRLPAGLSRVARAGGGRAGGSRARAAGPPELTLQAARVIMASRVYSEEK